MSATQQGFLYNNKMANRNIPVFILFWVITFFLYLPAANAGFVIDFTGWLDQVKNQPFGDYINRNNFSVKSLYQFTQLLSWLLYKLLGTSHWGWHLLFVSLQAANAWLLWRFVTSMLNKAGKTNGNIIALSASFLFCICPHISEVIVWEPSFHYLLGLFLTLTILSWIHAFMESGKKKYLVGVLVLYFLSLFSLEYFYLAPFFALSYIFYHRHGFGGPRIKNAFLYLFLPMLVMLLLRLMLFRVLYNDWVSRIGSGTIMGDLMPFAAKPLKYVFHVLFFGRFWGQEMRDKVYAFCESSKAIYSFYGLCLLLAAAYLLRFRKMNTTFRIAGLFLLWTALASAVVSPMWFPQSMLLQMDRYTYLLLPFGFVTLSLLLWALPKKIAIPLLIIYALVNINFTLTLNIYWKKSSDVVKNLLHTLPDPGNRTTILLNVPESLNGVPMIAAGSQGEYKLMHNLLLPKPINTKVYDAVGFNLLTKWDGANVIVINDSLVKVTLNQWGTWWWRDGVGAGSYENEDYKLNLVDPGHWYELTLKHPAENYLLLYLVDGEWRQVDMSLKGVQQD